MYLCIETYIFFLTSNVLLHSPTTRISKQYYCNNNNNYCLRTKIIIISMPSRHNRYERKISTCPRTNVLPVPRQHREIGRNYYYLYSWSWVGHTHAYTLQYIHSILSYIRYCKFVNQYLGNCEL